MESPGLYLLKSVVISGLLTAWYMLVLRNRRLHRYNRFFLLAILFFSLTIPLFQVRFFSIPATVSRNFAPAPLVAAAGREISTGTVLLPAAWSPDYLAIAGLAAAGISLTLLIGLFIKIAKLSRMCRRHPVMRIEGARLVLTEAPGTPFTFLHFIFWRASASWQDEVGRLMLRHELTHVRQGHTYDRLACQLLNCIFWFNPFYRIIRSELAMVHEFEADEHAINNGDTSVFASMLLRSCANGSYLAPEHHFFSSPVKRRIKMMQEDKKPSYGIARKLLAIPVIGIAFLLFSFGLRDRSGRAVSPAEKKIVLLLDVPHGERRAGTGPAAYPGEEICRKYARRIAALSAAYNVDVRLVGDDYNAVRKDARLLVAGDASSGFYLALHLDDEPATEPAKGDIQIYVSGDRTHAARTRAYSNGIFGALAGGGIIPGARPADHRHAAGCHCGNCASPAPVNAAVARGFTAEHPESLNLLHRLNTPGLLLVLGNVNSVECMKRLTDETRLDGVCRAILSGIVAGAAAQPDFTADPLGDLLLNAGKSSTCSP